MHRSSDVGILSMYINNDLASLSVETMVLMLEANFLADSSGFSLKINLILVDRDLSKQNNHTSLTSSFHSNLSVRIDLQTSIKNSI